MQDAGVIVSSCDSAFKSVVSVSLKHPMLKGVSIRSSGGVNTNIALSESPSLLVPPAVTLRFTLAIRMYLFS